jgi:glycosyltransferase involved in cell wall biosynthesis
LLIRTKNIEEVKKEVGNSLKLVVCDALHYSLKEQIFLPLQLIKLKPDLVHFPHFNVPILYFGKYIITIHDLIKHVSKGRETTTRNPFLYWLKYFGYQIVFLSAVKRASKILVPSEWVKKELAKEYHLDPGKIVVTYEGAGREFQISPSDSEGKFQISNKILEKYKIKKPFVIYTGSLYPHKNIERLIEAMKLIKQPKVTLTIVCARSVFWERMRERVKKMEAENLVNLAGFVPDSELKILYQEAIALIQPSLMEGFDLNVVEAMAVGLPVVVSDIPVHREICGQVALYFDPYSPKEIVDKIKFIVENKKERERLKKLGLDQVKKYSWQKMAEQTLRAYEEDQNN